MFVSNISASSPHHLLPPRMSSQHVENTMICYHAHVCFRSSMESWTQRVKQNPHTLFLHAIYQEIYTIIHIFRLECLSRRTWNNFLREESYIHKLHNNKELHLVFYILLHFYLSRKYMFMENIHIIETNENKAIFSEHTSKAKKLLL